MTISLLSTKAAAAAAAVAAAVVVSAVPASANPDVVAFGSSAEMSSASGAEVTDYTVRDLQPSGNNDGVWFADVSVAADKGAVTPIIGDFNARAANGATYTSIEGSSPDGLTNQPIAPGGVANGRIYFQVNNGPAPDSVVYSTGANGDRVIWKS